MKPLYKKIGISTVVAIVIVLLTGFVMSLTEGIMPIQTPHDVDITYYGYPFSWIYEMRDHYSGLYKGNIYDVMSFIIDFFIYFLVVFLSWMFLEKRLQKLQKRRETA